jgi:hypothetical protein
MICRGLSYVSIFRLSIVPHLNDYSKAYRHICFSMVRKSFLLLAGLDSGKRTIFLSGVRQTCKNTKLLNSSAGSLPLCLDRTGGDFFHTIAGT